ncbi:MAG: hypothetical protein QM757_39985 [Paludibaculum sp.]
MDKYRWIRRMPGPPALLPKLGQLTLRRLVNHQGPIAARHEWTCVVGIRFRRVLRHPQQLLPVLIHGRVPVIVTGEQLAGIQVPAAASHPIFQHGGFSSRHVSAGHHHGCRRQGPKLLAGCGGWTGCSAEAEYSTGSESTSNRAHPGFVIDFDQLIRPSMIRSILPPILLDRAIAVASQLNRDRTVAIVTANSSTTLA